MLQELNSNIGGPIENKIYTIRGTQVMLDFDFLKKKLNPEVCLSTGTPGDYSAKICKNFKLYNL